ncbi:MAG: YraN family protein [Phycisphaerales bacterium]|nr:YraN family protein [Planctomycetota bacterium]MCH8509067.1 YraN family protein [Phycisphaerales bacterium]
MRLWPGPREDQRGIWKRGERAAARAMRRAGCRVIARNLVLGPGEIDLLCLERKTGAFVVVEVKARIDRGDGRRPEDAITAAKKRKLVQLARALQRDGRVRGKPIRIDVVAVVFASGRRRAVEVRRFEGAVRDESGMGRAGTK